MLDKEKIKNNFKKSLKTYDTNAVVQKYAAEKLVSFLKGKKYNSILEIGSYSGLLTKEIVANTNFESYLALDIIDSFDSIKNLSPKIKTKIADIETWQPKEKYDLIVSTSSLQWCNCLSDTLVKLKNSLNKNSTLAICIYGRKNFFYILSCVLISCRVGTVS